MELRAVAILGCATAALGCAKAPLHRPHLEAESYFVAPYVAAREQSCEGRLFSLKFGDRSSILIETNPPIEESDLQLRTCTDKMNFLLDCVKYADGEYCAAHDWPLPAESILGGDNELSHELATVAALAPKCPREKSCRAKSGCSGDGFTLSLIDTPALRQLPSTRDFTTAFYEVERCGSKRTVSIVCQNRAPFLCRTDVRDWP